MQQLPSTKNSISSQHKSVVCSLYYPGAVYVSYRESSPGNENHTLYLYDLTLEIRGKTDSLPFLGQCFRLARYVLVNDDLVTNNQIAEKQGIGSVLLQSSI